MEDAFAYAVAQVKIEVAVFAGRGSSIDLAVTNPVGMCPILSVGVAGSTAVRTEAGKDHKYEDMVRAGGDFGTCGKGALDVLQWITDAAFGEAPVVKRNRFKWTAAQQIGVYGLRGAFRCGGP